MTFGFENSRNYNKIIYFYTLQEFIVERTSYELAWSSEIKYVWLNMVYVYKT